jgi:hypothetical protein
MLRSEDLEADQFFRRPESCHYSPLTEAYIQPSSSVKKFTRTSPNAKWMIVDRRAPELSGTAYGTLTRKSAPEDTSFYYCVSAMCAAISAN